MRLRLLFILTVLLLSTSAASSQNNAPIDIGLPPCVDIPLDIPIDQEREREWTYWRCNFVVTLHGVGRKWRVEGNASLTLKNIRDCRVQEWRGLRTGAKERNNWVQYHVTILSDTCTFNVTAWTHRPDRMWLVRFDDTCFRRPKCWPPQ